MNSYFFSLSTGKKKIDISLDSLKYFRAMGAYTLVIHSNGTEYVKSINIGAIEKVLQHSHLFFRSHESYLVNVLYINWQEKPYNGTFAMIDGSRMRISRRNERFF